LGGELAVVAPVIFQVRVVMLLSGSLVIAARPLNAAWQFEVVFEVMSPGQVIVGGAARMLKGMKLGEDLLFNKLSEAK